MSASGSLAAAKAFRPANGWFWVVTRLRSSANYQTRNQEWPRPLRWLMREVCQIHPDGWIA